MANKKYYKKDSKDESKEKKYSKKSNNRDKAEAGRSSATSYSKNEGQSKKYASDEKNMERYIGTSNDISWYNKNKRLIEDVSKIPFGYQLGKPIPQYNTTEGTYDLNGAVIPGIYTLDMVNVPGIAVNSSDGVNLAATGLLQFIRKHLSTVGLYASADTMMYVLGIDDIYSDFANIARLFGLVNAYSAINMYFPKYMLEAIYGIDDEEFTKLTRHMNDYRSWFNNLIFKASTLYLPTDFSITDRHSWNYMNCFTDDSVLKAQVYAYTKKAGYILDETTSSEGTMLKYQATPTTIDGLLEAFEAKIDAYRNSDSMMKIAADMRRAFDGHMKWSLFYIDENWIVVPRPDPTVLNQIHNTGAIYDWNSYSGKDITQSVDKNIILYHPHIEVSDDPEDVTLKQSSLLCNDRLFNFHWDDVSPDDIVEGTRNQPVLKLVGSPEEGTLYIDQCGADLCVGLHAHVLDESTTELQTLDVNNVVIIEDDASVIPVVIPVWSFTAAFNWAPILYGVQLNTGYTHTMPLTEISNYTVINAENLARMHSNVMCSMYAIPEFGGFDA